MDCVIHIGTEKTGTTSIQQTLDAHADLLLSNGLFWPPLLREGQDSRVACYAMDDSTKDLRKRRRKLTTPEAIAAFRDRFEGRIRRELRAAPDCRTMLIVNEHLSRMRRPSEPARLKAFLEQFFDGFQIIVYLRRQDKLMRSMYSQIIKIGSTRDHVFPKFDPNRKGDYLTFNARRIVELWVKTFGRDAVRIRVFEKDELKDGDVVRDFFHTAGLDLPEGLTPLRVNESLSAEALLTLRAINRHLPRENRGNMGPLSGRLFSGPGMPVTRAEAEAFLSHFQRGNDYVARTYLGRKRLFDPIRPDEYPETLDPAALEVSPDQMAWHFARLWEARIGKG